jgi:hypothetical protein
MAQDLLDEFSAYHNNEYTAGTLLKQCTAARFSQNKFHMWTACARNNCMMTVTSILAVLLQ